jgi:DNA end-binding protein Ku
MARPYWSGQVQISLVSFGVKLFTATESRSQISFREIDRRTGERIHHQNVTESEGAVDRSDIVKGYEYSKGEYVVLEPKELDRLRIPTKRAIEIRQFVKQDEIELSYFEKPYFVIPENDEQAKTFNVFRKALADTGRAGLGEVTFGGREHLVAIMPADGKDSTGMMAYALRYSEELRDGKKVFSEIKSTKVDSDQLALAKELIQRSSAKFEPEKFKDDYEAALREVIEAKLQHKPLAREAPRKTAKVINLTEALRRSLNEQTANRGEGAPTSAKKRMRAAQGKGPMLVESAGRKRRPA